MPRAQYTQVAISLGSGYKLLFYPNDSPQVVTGLSADQPYCFAVGYIYGTTAKPKVAYSVPGASTAAYPARPARADAARLTVSISRAMGREGAAQPGATGCSRGRGPPGLVAEPPGRGRVSLADLVVEGPLGQDGELADRGARRGRCPPPTSRHRARCTPGWARLPVRAG